MGSSWRGRRNNILWLLALLLLLSLCSINGDGWYGLSVDAAMDDPSFSFSSRCVHQGYGLPNRNSRVKQQHHQHAERKQQRRVQLPWLLPHNSIISMKENGILLSSNNDPSSQDSFDAISPWRIATASLLKLRGGSNKSGFGTSSSSVANKNKDRRRSDKPKKSNGNKHKRNDGGERQNKHRSKTKTKQTGDGDDDNDDADDGDKTNKHDELSDGSSSQDTEDDSALATDSATMEKESMSKLFLIDPFRMNEIARYEASISKEPSEQEANDDDVAAEKTAIATSNLGLNDDEDPKKKRRSKKGKKKMDPEKSTTTDLGSESSIGVEEPEILTDKGDEVRNSKRKKREQQQQKVKRNRTTDTRREEMRKGVNTAASAGERDALDDFDGELMTATGDDVNELNEEDDATAGDSDAAEQSNPFWWIDVWTQQLSDPEDIEEGDEIEDSPIDIDALSDMTVGDANETKANDSDSDSFRKVGEQVLTSPIEENIELPTKPDRSDLIAAGSDSLAKIDENDSTSTTKWSENETTSLVLDQNLTSSTSEILEAPVSYVSSGAWVLIDNMLTIGLASKFSSLRLSQKLRLIRKLSARITRLHGFLSGKPSSSLPLDVFIDTATNVTANTESSTAMDGEESMEVIQKRIAAIDRAREGVERAQAEEKEKRRKRSIWGFRPKADVIDLYQDSNETKLDEDTTTTSELDEVGEPKIPQKSPEEIEEEFQRMERVREIDQLIAEGQNRLADLICEKDVLQRRPNPLFNYTTTESKSETNTTSKIEIQATREMNFPPDDLVADYLDMMLSTRRLAKMNHTDLWKESDDDVDDDEEEESIGDDLFTASANAHRLYHGVPSVNKNGNGMSKSGKKSGGGGSWLLRQSIGKSRSLGEKIGEAAETAAYKAVTASLMSFLARLISSLHGINVLKHSDIRLVLEQSPDLPPVPKDGIIRGNHQNYAEETIKTVMRSSKSRRSKKRPSKASFVQQEAVTETLLSHVQISAPLLKLFPLAWQRALLGNIISLSCALISDFLDGLNFQILGHQLSFTFRPITEVDMARHFQMAGGRFNKRRYKAAEFEAAVQATAEDLKEELQFLDSWHERALGSGVLRTQIANMIARIVLTLTDEVLSGAQMDLWSVQAGGPRMLAGLEHRIEDDDEEDE